MFESVQIKSEFFDFYHGIKAIEKFICLVQFQWSSVNEAKMILRYKFSIVNKVKHE